MKSNFFTKATGKLAVALLLVSTGVVLNAQTYYSTNFENGCSGWNVGYETHTCGGNPNTVGSSWLCTDSTTGTVPMYLGSHAFGATNSNGGTEHSWVSTPVMVINSQSILIEFDSWSSNSAGYPCMDDVEFVEITTDGGITWAPIHGYVPDLHSRTCDQTWRHIVMAVSLPANTTVKFRFRYDSGDEYNHGTFTTHGWYIDNLVVKVGFAFTYNKSDAVCEGSNNGSISITSVPGGVAPFRYSINGGTTFTTTSNFRNLRAGVYNVVVKDNLNRLSAVLPVTVGFTKTVNTTISTTGNLAICEGGQVNLTAYSATGYTHQWYKNGLIITGATLPTYTANCKGAFTVSSNYDGCTKTSPAVTITQAIPPTFEVEKQATCADKTEGAIAFKNITGTAPYAFSIDSGKTYQASANFTNLAVGNYALVLTDNAACKSVVKQESISTLIDTIKPVVLTKPATVYLMNGTASVSTLQVNDGSFDNCEIANIQVSPNTFSNDDYGVKQVNLIVTDKSGNTSSAPVNVTIRSGVPVTCALNLVRSAGANTNGPVSTIYLGYGPQNVGIQALAGGTAPFTYSWSGASGLTNTNTPTATFTPTAAGNYSLTCTVTDRFGLTATSSINVCVINAIDPSNSNKILVCKNNKTMSVNANAVQAQLNNGNNTLGSCGAACNGLNKKEDEEVITALDCNINVVVYPNPSKFGSGINFLVVSESDAPVTILMRNINGEEVLALTNQQANTELNIGSQLSAGIYFATVIQGDFAKIIRISKVH